VFFAAGAEALSRSPFGGRADLVTVTFPWGSLLRGVLGLDEAVLGGVASVLRPGGRIEVLASVVPSDRLDGLECLDATHAAAITAGWAAVGLRLTAMHPAEPADVAASGSSWSRRLGLDRPVWRIDGVRTG
jgi:16S rRNA (adenine(1408)-N(1))-methyltransferase